MLRRWNRAAALILVPLFVVFGYFLLGRVFLATGVDSIVSTLLCDVTMFVAAFLYLRKRPVPVEGDGRSVTRVPIKPVCVILLAVMWIFGQITASYVLDVTGDPAFQSYQSNLHDVSGIYMFLSLLLTCAIAPLCEEFLMRGIVFGTWCRLNPWFGLIGSALLFSLMHGTLTHLVPTFLVGLLFATAYATTGSLWFSVLLHVGYNLGASVLANAAVPAFFFEPYVFVTADVLLVAWALVEFRHALRTDGARASADEEVGKDGETQTEA